MSIREKIAKGIACDTIGKPDSIFGRAVCLSVHPGKMILFPFAAWFHKRYKGQYKFARFIFTIDLVLVGIILGLGIAAIMTVFFPGHQFVDDITFSASVAPREIVAGAPSTLVIRYFNGTEEELKNAQLSFTYPDHFLLQEIISTDDEIENNIIELGDVPIGGNGSIKIKGVMFGDVNGEQTFKSSLAFTHGVDKTIAEEKIDEYTFSPARSTLALELLLPEKIYDFQTVDGLIIIKNTGDIDFPEISIKPEWPKEFAVRYIYNPFIYDEDKNDYKAESIKAGESIKMQFLGDFDDVQDEVVFVFHPSFVFDKTRYKQETLRHTAPVAPPQLTINHSLNQNSLRPGSSVEALLSYEHIGEFDIYDVRIGIESYSPFALTPDLFDSNSYPELKHLQPGDTGTIEIDFSLKSSIFQSQTDVYENLQFNSRPIAEYVLDDGPRTRMINKGTELLHPIITPIILESFGRYTTASGDQIGRGPLPPRIGIETKYWIFWRIGGTTNPISNVVIEGDLEKNVRFTGRQTVSQDSGVEYDPDTNSISWSSEEILPTLSPTSRIVAVAFELGITPTEDQINTIATLIKNLRLTATDASTGAFISTSAPKVTTDLPDDLKAGGKAFIY